MKLTEVDPILMEEVMSAVGRESLLRDSREISRSVRISGSEEEASAFDYIEQRCIQSGASGHTRRHARCPGGGRVPQAR